jgi:excisionase family DNA binding protein
MTGLTARDAAELKAAAEEIRDAHPKAALWLEYGVRKLVGPARGNLSTREVAEFLGVTPQTVRNWVDRGWLEGSRHRLGRRQIPIEALSAVIEMRAAQRRIVREPWTESEIDALLAEARSARSTDAGHP